MLQSLLGPVQKALGAISCVAQKAGGKHLSHPRCCHATATPIRIKLHLVNIVSRCGVCIHLSFAERFKPWSRCGTRGLLSGSHEGKRRAHTGPPAQVCCWPGVRSLHHQMFEVKSACSAQLLSAASYRYESNIRAVPNDREPLPIRFSASYVRCVGHSLHAHNPRRHKACRGLSTVKTSRQIHPPAPPAAVHSPRPHRARQTPCCAAPSAGRGPAPCARQSRSPWP